MPVILIGVPSSVRLGRIVGATVVAGLLTGLGRIGGQNRAALAQIQVHLALQMNRKAEIRTRRKNNYTPASCCRGVNRAIHGLCVGSLSIAGRAKFPHIEDALRSDRIGIRPLLSRGRERNKREPRSRHTETARAQKIPPHCVKRFHPKTLRCVMVDLASSWSFSGTSLHTRNCQLLMDTPLQTSLLRGSIRLASLHLKAKRPDSEMSPPDLSPS
jgi:hypothetical protein